MWNRSKPTQIKVPPVVLYVKIKLLHLLNENIQSFLPLTSTHKLAYARHEQIHRIHSLSSIFVVIPHVKRLNRFRVVVNKDSTLKLGLCQPSLMFRCQICSKHHLWKLPLGWILGDFFLQICNGFLIRHPHKRFVHQFLQPIFQTLIKKIGKECQILITLLQRHPDHRLQQCLGIVHRRCQVRKGHFGLDHPKLGKMTCRLRVLRTKGWSKGIHISQCRGIGLATQLSRHR
mmetsp:Transcript_23292/g.50455  ORF Transcript_23292/g.50455 Transcript_23292/m.50455 type:complete len:231 (-) Transcript_23292:1455-2147(-)